MPQWWNWQTLRFQKPAERKFYIGSSPICGTMTFEFISLSAYKGFFLLKVCYVHKGFFDGGLLSVNYSGKQLKMLDVLFFRIK